jgi:hypothetical protein
MRGPRARTRRAGAAPPALIALVLLAVVALGACGRKAAPVAPERRVPQIVGGLTGVVRDEAVELRWQNPSRRVDDTRLRDLTVVRVYRAEDAAAGEPRPALLVDGRIAGYAEVATVRQDVAGDTTRYVDHRGLAYGRRYTYVLLAQDSLGRVSSPSARVSVVYAPAPVAPAEVRAEAGEAQARLRWTPSTRLVDGTVAPARVTYQVLRATSPDAPLEPVTPAPVPELVFVDRGLQNDQMYYYAVRAVRDDTGVPTLGPPSTPVSVAPRDMTPPSPPAGLVAIPSEGTVRLAWNASPEADVARYVVYRTDARGVRTRVGSARPPTTVFIDRDVPAGAYRYTVTAEDAGVTPNESRPSNDASVSVP